MREMDERGRMQRVRQKDKGEKLWDKEMNAKAKAVLVKRTQIKGKKNFKSTSLLCSGY